MQVGCHHVVLVHVSQHSTRASAHLLAKEKAHPERLHQAVTCIVVLPLVMGHEPDPKPGRGVFNVEGDVLAEPLAQFTISTAPHTIPPSPVQLGGPSFGKQPGTT
jgi:hypothetical protein